MKDRIGQDPANVTEHRAVAENHLIPTGNLLFPQVIILIHDFYLLIQYFLQKIILRLTEIIQTCAENITLFQQKPSTFLKCWNIFVSTL